MTAAVFHRIGGEPRCRCGAFLRDPKSVHKGGVGCGWNGAEPEDSRWHPATRAQRWLTSPIVHEVLALSHWLWIRDRLRCPKCKAVGTWKPHGALLYRWIYKDISVRRWLCKWCGHYINRTGSVVAYPDLTGSGVWALPELGVPRQPTPAEALRESLGKCWPWLG